MMVQVKESRAGHDRSGSATRSANDRSNLARVPP